MGVQCVDKFHTLPLAQENVPVLYKKFQKL